MNNCKKLNMKIIRKVCRYRRVSILSVLQSTFELSYGTPNEQVNNPH